jgi:putative ABC transport system permease protein
MIIRNLLRRRTRTLLTLAGIAIGIAAIVTLTAMAEGFVTNFGDVLSNTEADLSVLGKQEPGGVLQPSRNGLDERHAEEIRAMPDVRAVAGMVYAVVPMPGVPYFVVFGHDLDQFAIRRFKVTEGEALSTRRAGYRGRPLLLGRVASENLEKGVGDTLTIYDTTYRIVGMYETGSVIEDAGAVVSLDEGQRIASMPRQVLSLWVQVRRPERVDQVQQRLSRRYPDLEITRTGEKTGVASMLEVIQPFAWAVALIAALVGGVGMMNATLMSVFERTREIGVLRALGWRRWKVVVMILGESVVLSIAGGCAGAALGVLLVHAAASSPALSGFMTGGLNITSFMRAFLSALVFGLIGGLYPALRASRLTPVEALRYDGSSASSQGRRVWGGMALRNLMRQRTRTALTFVGVGIGVLALVAITSLAQGTVDELYRMTATTELTAVQAGISDFAFSSIHERVGKRLESLPEVEYAAGSNMTFTSMKGNPLFMIAGYAPHSPQWDRFHVLRGTRPQGPGQVMLGWKGADLMRKDVGDTLRFLGSQYRVVGIYETGTEYLDTGSVITLREVQRRTGQPRQVMFYEIKLVDPEKVNSVLTKLQDEFPELSISRSAEFAENLPDLRNMQSMLDAITGMTMLVGSVVVMNTMAMSVFERTREIGVLRALGWSRRRIVGLIVSESAMMTLGGGLVGTVAAWLLVNAIALVPGWGMLGRITSFSSEVLGQAAALCVGLGILGGVYPAWRASKLLPVEALRYE